MFEKILIANRGEIAVRIIKVCKEMGIKSVAIYSEADKDALHTKMADEAICIGPAPSGDSYLNMENIISAAVGTGAQAIHPGFGFLSENSLFAEKCKVCNITFIGPTPEVICKMGNKVEARNMMRNAGVPIISGSRTPVFDVCEAKKVALELGFPIMIKAAAGGGGKGMRISNTEDDFNENFVTAQMEANSSFRDGTMYLERYIEAPNHIEFQILADKYGNVIQLGERDCSIQRHHQKIIEEAPSPKLSVKLRKEMGNIAIKVAKIVNYEGAGTVEFLLDKFGNSSSGDHYAGGELWSSPTQIASFPAEIPAQGSFRQKEEKSNLFKPCYKNLFQISPSCDLSEYEQLSGTVYRDYLCQPAVDVWITPSFGLISLSGGNPE